tara:strand:- start:307 stop:543 length:237 start_codon:yes stop_codon:yes gene_type:complete
MEVGDLVKQRGAGISLISELIKNNLNMGCIGVIVEVHDKRYFSYEGTDRGDVTVQWANGNTEILPEIYLEKLEDEQGT